jgi:hypothetical protein
MKLADRVLGALAHRAFDDDELAATFGVARQGVNQVCRRLAHEGRVVRRAPAGGKIVNYLAGRAPIEAVAVTRNAVEAGPLLTEDEVKSAVQGHLARGGYDVTVMWGRQRGTDIVAVRNGDRVLLEAKGEAKNPAQQVNYFLGAIGELVQRMDDPEARYGLALPDNRQYRGLVGRLPGHAKSMLGLIVLFVTRTGSTCRVEEVS